MSLSRLNRRGFFTGLATLSACGFEPVYQGSKTSPLWGRIELPAATDAESFAIRRILAGYFGEPTQAQYRLEIEYNSTVNKLAITQSSVVTRYRITASGRFHAIKINDEATILDQSFKRVASYSANKDRFAADQTQDATKIRLAEVVADEYATRFIAAISQLDK